MNDFPKNRVYLIIFGLLFFYFSIIFIIERKAKFNQFNYDWDSETTVKKIKNVVVDSVGYNYISLFNVNEKPNIKNTFLFQSKSDKYYFRASSILKNDNKTAFKHVIWLLDKKPQKHQKGILKLVDLKLKQSGKLTVNTFGDTFLNYGAAQYFRKFISQDKQVVFVGNNPDLYGFPNDAFSYLSSSKLVAKLKDVKEANIYILFFGNHDGKLSDKEILLNWNTILTFFENRKETKKILVLSLPPSEKENIKKYRRRYNNLIYKLKEKHSFVLINTDSIISDTDLDYLKSYPNKNGFKKIAKAVIPYLHEAN